MKKSNQTKEITKEKAGSMETTELRGYEIGECRNRKIETNIGRRRGLTVLLKRDQHKIEYKIRKIVTFDGLWPFPRSLYISYFPFDMFFDF